MAGKSKRNKTDEQRPKKTWAHMSRKDFDTLRNLPRKQSIKGGTLDFARGDIATRPGSQSMYMWDVVMDCMHHDCPLHHRCPYFRRIKKIKNLDKCKVQMEYINIVYKALMDRFDCAKITNEQVMRIGMQVLPLYTQLFKMKMIEFNVGMDDVVSKSGKGGKSIHPIYKEIRELIKTINTVWKSVGSENVKPNKKKSKEVEKDVEGFGDSAFYEMMMEGKEFENGKPQWEDPPEEGEGISFEEEPVKEKPKSKKKKKDEKPRKKKIYSKSSKKVRGFNTVKNKKGLNGQESTVERDDDVY